MKAVLALPLVGRLIARLPSQRVASITTIKDTE